MEDYDACYHNLLQLLSFSLFNEEPQFDDSVDWDAIFKESIKQAVFPLTFSAATNFAAEDVISKWQKIFDMNIAGNIRVFADHFELNNILNKSSIPYVILKGAVSAQYYPNPVLRSMGDVDFLVRKSDVAVAENLLSSFGFLPRKHNESNHHINLKRKNANGGFSVFELHWQPAGVPNNIIIKEKILNAFDDAFCRAKKTKLLNGEFNSPESLCHGLTLLLHNVEHLFKSGIGLRHLCDWAVFVNSFTSDEFCSVFEQVLKSVGLWNFCCCLTCVCVKYLKCRNFDWAKADANLTDDLLTDILASGNFASKDLSRFYQAKLMGNYSNSEADPSVKLSNVFKSIGAKAKLKAPLCNRYKVLLPFCMLYVFLQHCFRILLGKRPRIDFKRTQRGAKERSKIYSQLNIFKN